MNIVTGLELTFVWYREAGPDGCFECRLAARCAEELLPLPHCTLWIQIEAASFPTSREALRQSLSAVARDMLVTTELSAALSNDLTEHDAELTQSIAAIPMTVAAAAREPVEPPRLALLDIDWTGSGWQVVAIFEDNTWQTVGNQRYATPEEARSFLDQRRPQLQRLFGRA